MAINTSKVVVGGLVSGVVANLIDFIVNNYLLKDMMTESMNKLNPSLAASAMSGSSIAGFVVLDFILSIATIWLYAAIRPRFGAGPKTAVYAALAAWILGSTVAGFFLFQGIFSAQVFCANAAVALVNSVVATLVGARFYSEA